MPAKTGRKDVRCQLSDVREQPSCEGVGCQLPGVRELPLLRGLAIPAFPAFSSPPIILVRECSEASLSGQRDGSEEVRTRTRESVAKVKRKRRESGEKLTGLPAGRQVEKLTGRGS